MLWNASRVLCDYLQEHAASLVLGKDVLELGAGAGLPSIVCAVLGARKVVVTDYPDADLVDNLSFNIRQCAQLRESKSIVSAEACLPLYPCGLPSFPLLLLSFLTLFCFPWLKSNCRSGLSLGRSSISCPRAGFLAPAPRRRAFQLF